MYHPTTIAIPALLIALIALALASSPALAGGQPDAVSEIPDRGPLCHFHRAAQRSEPAVGLPEREPRATYGMITLTRLEIIANTTNLDWETIRFLEVNLAGSPSRFAFAVAPAG